MVKIDVKFNSSELADKMRSGIYSAPDDSTVSDLLELALAEAGVEISNELMGNLVFLYNDRYAAIDSILSDGGRLRVLHKVMGG